MKTNYSKLLFLIMTIPIFTFGQVVITGTVTETSTSDPLPDVNITIKGNSLTGTTTDFNGNYSIKANTNDILVFSYVGYLTQEVTVGNNTTLDVSLNNDEANTLDEVIVIGYGTTTIKDATGAVASITSKDFNQGNIVTPASLITGRIAGVNVTSNGAPGGGSTIRIRGGASLNASNDPLIVIDGFPITNDNVDGSRSILAAINPGDIESFSILKDASATAIYGSRASNGVIIITTKKGKSTFQATLDLKFGYQTLTDKIDVFSADEFRNLIAQREGLLGQSNISVDQLGNANTDWQEEIYKDSFTADKAFSMRGSLFNKIPTRFSLTHTDQPGLRRTSHFERGGTSLSLSPKLFKEHLKVNLNVNLSQEKNRFAEAVEGAAMRMDPTQPVHDSNSPFGGFFEYYTYDNDGILRASNAPRNPVASLLQRKDLSLVTRLYGNIEFDYKFHFLPELKAVVNLGYDDSSAKGNKTRSVESIRGFKEGDDFLGNEDTYTDKIQNKLLDGYLVYNKGFDNTNVEFTAGYSYQKFERESFKSGELRDIDREADLAIFPDNVLIGFFGRTNLSFMDKYLFTLSYRRDGTSRFSEDNRWGDFPAAAFAWKMTEEDFLKNSTMFSNLKLRLGWGITGQQDLGKDASLAFLGINTFGSSVSQYIFGDTSIPVSIPQSRFENVKWEETTTYNVGLDYGLFKGKVSGAVEVYLKETKDLLSEVSIPDGSNFSNIGIQNIGKLTSKGIEFSIGTDIYKTDNFNWSVNYNIGLNDVKINTLAGGQDIGVGGIDGGTGSRVQLLREGFAPYSFFVYKQLYDTNGNPIEDAYVDLNQDGVITPDDRYIYKKPNADVVMGFQSNLTYKKIDFSFNLRTSLGNYAYNNVNSSKAQYNLLQATTALGNIPTSVLETNFSNSTAELLLSDIFIENASFLKMDNITLGYTFDKFKNGKTNIRLWTGVQNVFTVTNYSGLDPEIYGDPGANIFGIDKTIYPTPRTFLMGINIKF